MPLCGESGYEWGDKATMIEANNLVKKFGEKSALDSATFQIGEKSVFGLVGSNGAGKSTFLRTVAGIYKPDGGTVTVDGAEPFENSQVKGKTFFVSDFPYFPPHATLKKMAPRLAEIYPNWDWKRFEALNKVFPVGEKKRISTMSKGMQRQAALICALSTRPKYLLMDEVFDGLDPVMRLCLKQIILDDVSSGTTAVIASHNLRELEDLCDHIGLLHNGGVVFAKALDELSLGLCKAKAIFRSMPEKESLAPLEILHWETSGSLVNFVARAGREEVLTQLNTMNPVFVEVLPLSLEEVFIYEMGERGYDVKNVLSTEEK